MQSVYTVRERIFFIWNIYFRPVKVVIFEDERLSV